MLHYLPAIRRFWWLIPVGIFLAVSTVVVLVYRVEPGIPPQLSPRDKITYLAGTDLLVDGRAGPYLRVSQPTLDAVGEAEPAQTTVGTQTTFPGDTAVVPYVDRGTLVDAANLFPLLIMSDEIRKRRERLVGPDRGSVNANALFAFQGNNRFRPAVLPVVQIQATAGTPKAAITLVNGTVRAFTAWLIAEQRRADIPPGQRIFVKELRQAGVARPLGGTSWSLPLLAGAAVFFAVLAFAVLLDRYRPRSGTTTPTATSHSANTSADNTQNGEFEGDLAAAVQRISRDVSELLEHMPQRDPSKPAP
jgi:hypothetical protein